MVYRQVKVCESLICSHAAQAINPGGRIWRIVKTQQRGEDKHLSECVDMQQELRTQLLIAAFGKGL